MAAPFGPIPGGAPSTPSPALDPGSALSSLFSGASSQNDSQALTSLVRPVQMALIELAGRIPALSAFVQRVNGELIEEVARIGAMLPEQQGINIPPTGTSMGPLG